LQSIHERLVFATTIEERSISAHRGEWDAAIASITNENECPQYRGLVIEPQIGIVPIGQDPRTQFWEFAHLQTGALAKRGLEGEILFTEETGIVFVLLPGGCFPTGNADPAADDREKPVHEVTVPPFFISKHEMTQGQWLRFTAENPSRYGPRVTISGHYQHSLLHPVESVSWNDCAKTLSWLGLRLPSEAEWEYAARGGTTSKWWTGAKIESVRDAANFCDRFCRQNWGSEKWSFDDWLDEGFAIHAPVDSYRPNLFGLHNAMGNLREWCRDRYHVDYDGAPRDGSAREDGNDKRRIQRGGSWQDLVEDSYVVMRSRDDPAARYYTQGVRPTRSIETLSTEHE